MQYNRNVRSDQKSFAVSLFPARHVFETHLSSDCTIRLPWRRRLKDSLLLLRRQRGVQWNDLDISDLWSKVIHLTLYPFAGLVNFLREQRDLFFTFWVLGNKHGGVQPITRGPVDPGQTGETNRTS